MITTKRLAIWSFYHQSFASLEAAGKLYRPKNPAECGQNAHMYFIVLPNLDIRTRLISQMKEAGINTVFHYVPLHDALYGKKIGRVHGELPITRIASDCILRLPLWLGVEPQQKNIADKLADYLNLN